jgi:predicted RNase H-like HicB family nuclease
LTRFFSWRFLNLSVDTHEEAAQHGLEVIETFLEIWEEEGKSIPEPRALELVAA